MVWVPMDCCHGDGLKGGRVEAMGTWRDNKNPRTGCRERWARWQCSGLAGCTQFVHRVLAISELVHKLFACLVLEDIPRHLSSVLTEREVMAYQEQLAR